MSRILPSSAPPILRLLLSQYMHPLAHDHQCVVRGRSHLERALIPCHYDL